GEAALGPPAAGDHRAVPDDETGGMDPVGLHVRGIGAGVADVRVSEGDDLPAVGRIGEDFLVSRHGRIEYDLTDRLSVVSDGNTVEDRSVLQCQNRGSTQQQSSANN